MVGQLEITKLSVNPNFEVTLERLYELKEIDADLDEDEEDEVLYPSDYAFSVSIELLTQLYKRLGESFPRGFSSLESRGGINLIWTDQELDKEVRIKVPVSPQFQGSLYYRKGEYSELINPLSSDWDKTLIFRWLKWLAFVEIS